MFIDRYLGQKALGSEGVNYERLKPVDLRETASKVRYERLELPRAYSPA